MKHKITNEQAECAFDVELTHERMENGELRFRLFGDDLNGYIRTVATSKGGWQKSHVHTEFKEFYLVEFGWMAMAIPAPDGAPILKIYEEGQSCFSPPGQTHNIYLSADSVIHTIKFGVRKRGPRFEPRPDFDAMTTHLTEDQIRNGGRRNSN
jgi:oxalate decarboxylase/phosphoglucose isomerase-like protein (cupin superfamily)